VSSSADSAEILGPIETGHFLLARSLFIAGRFPEAIEEVDKILAHAPQLSIGHFIKGLVVQQSTQTAEALELLEAAVRLDDRRPDAWLSLANLKFDLGQVSEAQAAVSRALALDPTNAKAWFLKSTTADNPAAALAAAQRAAELDPGFELAHLRLGSLLQRAGRVEEATETALAALEINLLDVNARLSLIELLAGLGRFDEALDECHAACRAFHGKPQPLYQLGRLYTQLGRDDEAIAAYQGAIGAASNHIQSHLQLAELLLQQRRAAEAVVILKGALEIDAQLVEASDLLIVAEQRLVEEAAR
jgi:tetratricopeptide (TPR) repeat protein